MRPRVGRPCPNLTHDAPRPVSTLVPKASSFERNSGRVMAKVKGGTFSSPAGAPARVARDTPTTARPPWYSPPVEPATARRRLTASKARDDPGL